MAKYSLFFFTLLLSLSLGLFVGQNYLTESVSDEAQINETLNSKSLSESLETKIKSAINTVMDKIFAKDTLKSSHTTKYAESDSRSSTKEDLDFNPEVKDSDILNSKDEPQAQSLPKAKSEVQETSSAVTAKPKETETKSTNITKPEKVSTQNTESWVIQIAAFTSESDALKVEEQVKSYKFPHYYYKATLNDQTWFRVNIGPFKTLAEAAEFKQTNKVSLKFKGSFIKKL